MSDNPRPASLTCGAPHCDREIGHEGPHHHSGSIAAFMSTYGEPPVYGEPQFLPAVQYRDRGAQIANVIVTLTVCLAMLAILGSILYLIIR